MGSTWFGTRYMWQRQKCPSPATAALSCWELEALCWRDMAVAGARWQCEQRKTECREAQVICCMCDGGEGLLLPTAAADGARCSGRSVKTVRPHQSQAGQPHRAVRLHVQHHPTRSCRPHSRPISRQRQRVHRIP